MAANDFKGGNLVVTRLSDPREAETNTLVAAMTTAPTIDRVTLIDRVIRRLKNASLWAKLDVLYFFAAADSQAATLNWKVPTTFTASAVAAPTFTADRGFTGNGTTQYLSSGFNPSTAGGVFVQNSAHLSAWSRTSGNMDSGIIGMNTPTVNGSSYITAAFTDGNSYSLINGVSGNDITYIQATALGFSLVSRTASNAEATYRDGISRLSDALAGAAPISQNFILLGEGGNFAAAEVAQGSIGSGMTADDQATFYAIVREYLVAVGAA